MNDHVLHVALVEPEIHLPDVIVPADKVENLSVAPSSIALAKLEATLMGELDSYYRLMDELKRTRRKYQYVIIDTPPHIPHLRMFRNPVPSINPCCMAHGARTQ